MAYITNDYVAAYLGETLTNDQKAQVDVLISAAEAAANSYTNRKWGVSGPVTETFDGGVKIYFTGNSPITSVTSVVVDGQTLPITEYFVYSNYITLDSPTSSGNRNVVVTYVANNPVPADVQLALARWVSELYKGDKGSSGVVKRAQFGPGEVEYFEGSKNPLGTPDYVTTVLDRYRLMPV